MTEKGPSGGVIAALATVVVVVAVAAGVAWAGGQGGARIGGVPIMWLCAAVAFAVQWVAFVPAYVAQTERYYDLTGSLTYTTVVVSAVLATGSFDTRGIVVAALVLVWAVRLGSFLARRVHRDGGDSRFDAIKTSAARFFVAWTLQGLWVFLTLAAGLAAITAGAGVAIGPIEGLGCAVWVAGFAIEVTADRQKSAFRRDPHNRGAFIRTGLWAWSRHPNYFGEIVLWTGLAVVAAPTLAGWRWVTLVSPVFVALLLTRVSGVPILERRADQRWGGQPAYEAYKRSTPVLVLRPPRAS